MQKKSQWKVTMVSPNQIASKHYRCCTTTKAVQSFCTRYGVNHFWWTPPQGTQKVFMVDFKSFRACWSQVYGRTPTTITPKSKITSKTHNFTRTTASTKTNRPKNTKGTIVHKTYSYNRNKGTKTNLRRAA